MEQNPQIIPSTAAAAVEVYIHRVLLRGRWGISGGFLLLFVFFIILKDEIN